ncbi:MAG TPA: hypothetical protein VIG25_21810 [Pyrinomonadaceae bacterium]
MSVGKTSQLKLCPVRPYDQKTELRRYLFFEEDFRFEDDFFFEEDFFGTFAPSLRASERPIAIACFLLVTFLPDRPLFSVPLFRSCIALSTFLDAFLPYLAMFSPSFE